VTLERKGKIGPKLQTMQGAMTEGGGGARMRDIDRKAPQKGSNIEEQRGEGRNPVQSPSKDRKIKCQIGYGSNQLGARER